MRCVSTLKLFTSNRLEVLVEVLSEILKTPPASPFDEEIVVVQSQGMERWVSMELARRHGVCANMNFSFPNAFVHECFRKIITDIPEQTPFTPEIMVWKIMQILPSCIKQPGFESLKLYLAKAEGDLKLYQLSARIADTFDQYLLFRPEMTLEWENGEEKHWQAMLWRKLVAESENQHRAALGKAFLDKMDEAPRRGNPFPERVSVFGISTLPRFHMQVFAALSKWVEVNLFLMNPCREYWGDILSDREMKRMAAGQNMQDLPDEQLHLEQGNSLLASLGKQGRDFFDLINEFNAEEMRMFDEPGEQNLLARIQSGIMNLSDRSLKPGNKSVVSRDDTSIQIHSCHSPMREIEVLYDNLLKMFEEDPSLSPEDILVMAPDIKDYALYIEAVFDAPAGDPRRIPFSIADRTVREEGHVIDTFLAILDLCYSRFGVSRVLAVLDSPPVQRKFGLSDSDLDLIHQWVDDTRIRWGIDARGRRQMGLPDFSENTWKAGLERLLLGYPMAGRNEKMFDGVLPYDNIEGREALLLGKFLEFADQIFTRVTSLGQPKTLKDWYDTLTRLMEHFFLTDESSENEIQVVRRQLKGLVRRQEMSGFDNRVDLRVIKAYLEDGFAKKDFGSGFLTGGVTFCAMLPMRSIPFKVICLVGINNDAYPRRNKTLGFDLMAKQPRPGDRSRRNDDRYLFLEAILSAREKLYISYGGQSIRDNSLIPPSTLVSEIMDYIEQGFEVPEKNILEHIFTKHRLQAFSPEYFKEDEKLFSYSEVNCRAAASISKSRQEPRPFISNRISKPEEEWKTVSLDKLCDFFGNPAKFLLNRRLGIYFEKRAATLKEKEPFDIQGLEKYLLEKEMAENIFSGYNFRDFSMIAKASGRLPHGALGEYLLDTLNRGVSRFVEKTKRYMPESGMEPLVVDLDISGFKLTGRIDAVYPERLVQYRYAEIKPKDRLKIWIHHLVLNSLETDHYPRSSILMGLAPQSPEPVWKACEYAPLRNSKDVLGRLLETYWEGLMRPVHFFPKASWEYAQRCLKKNSPEKDALRHALHAWEGSDYLRGEREDPYYQACFGKTVPLDDEFRDIAAEVYGPLLKNQKELTNE